MPFYRWSDNPSGPWWLAPHFADPGQDLIGTGLDLQPATLLRAYRSGLFPMGFKDDGSPPMGWWSPDPRGVLLPGGIRVSRSLTKSMRRFEYSVDQAFEQVLAACADPRRPLPWITPPIAEAYRRLHRQGWAHSVEVWQAGELVGGLYGVAIGGLFAGESMFHHVRDASKAALVVLADQVFGSEDQRRMIDTQWRTEHLASLGVVEIPRAEYLRRLPPALAAGPIWGSHRPEVSIS